MSKTYKIIRFENGKPAQTIESNLSLSEAKKWHKDKPMRGAGWIEGWAKSEDDFSGYFGLPVEFIKDRKMAKQVEEATK
jgi:hypothetical protein